MTEHTTPITLTALLLAALACWTDLRSRRIPNVLTILGLFAGLALNVRADGLPGGVSSLGGGCIGLALFLPFMLLGGMGAGDVKLMAALGSLVGPAGILKLALAASLAGGLLALLRVCQEGRLRATLAGTAGLLLFWFSTGLRPSPELNLSNPSTIRIPYAIPIAVGTIAATLGHWS